jgi:tRNA A37 threonylcarbamoyladenosine dehydratase
MKIENVYVFGVGAAGSNVLLNLVFALPDINFTVIDFDKVEMRNISAGTQPYSKADLNRPKTQSIQKIVKMATGKSISALDTKIESPKDISNIVNNFKSSIIVDAFDNAKSRNLFHKISKEAHIVHVGFSKNLSGESTWDESYDIMSESKEDGNIDVCQMAMARPFISGLSAISALNISRFIETGEKVSCFFDKDLNIMKWS